MEKYFKVDTDYLSTRKYEILFPCKEYTIKELKKEWKEDNCIEIFGKLRGIKIVKR